MNAYCGDEFIGLAINNTVLRSVIVDTRRRKIRSLFEQNVDKKILDGGTFLEPELFKKALRQLVQDKKDKKSIPRCISISLPERYALTRELSFPNITKEEIAEAVTWQARNIFPLPIEDMYLDWKTLQGKDSTQEVFVVALPRRLVDDLVFILTELRFRPVNIQTSATCLGRLLPRDEEDLQILVNVNRDGATATLVTDNISKMTATASLGVESQKDVVGETVKTTKKLVEFYQTKHQTALSIKKIWLTGEFASREVANGLKEELALSVNFLKLPLSAEVNKKILTFSEAIAVALSPIEPPDSTQTINLLPPRIQKLYDSTVNLQQIKRWTSVVLVILLTGMITALFSYGYLFYKARDLEAEAPDLVAESETETGLEERLKQLNQQVDKLITLTDEKQTPRALISTLPQLIPEGILVTSWQYRDEVGQIVLEGRTDTRDTLLVLQDRLEKEDEFERVRIPLSSLEKEADYEFRIIIDLK